MRERLNKKQGGPHGQSFPGRDEGLERVDDSLERWGVLHQEWQEARRTSPEGNEVSFVGRALLLFSCKFVSIRCVRNDRDFSCELR